MAKYAHQRSLSGTANRACEVRFRSKTALYEYFVGHCKSYPSTAAARYRIICLVLAQFEEKISKHQISHTLSSNNK